MRTRVIVRGEWSGGRGGGRQLVPEGGISYEWGGAAAPPPPSLCWIRGCVQRAPLCSELKISVGVKSGGGGGGGYTSQVLALQYAAASKKASLPDRVSINGFCESTNDHLIHSSQELGSNDPLHFSSVLIHDHGVYATVLDRKLQLLWVLAHRSGGHAGITLVSSPDPDSQQLRVDYITATWTVGLGNKNDALVPSVPKHWDGCVHT